MPETQFVATPRRRHTDVDGGLRRRPPARNPITVRLFWD